ncbi:ERI1 exoribonuclease 3-like isoform X2 [Gordionus sp. m RMFG-2023]
MIIQSYEPIDPLSMFNNLLLLDFEATCSGKGAQPPDPQEIIEFPVIWVTIKPEPHQLEIRARFHRFVRPVIHPQISSFCSTLTGLTQETIEESFPLEHILEDFHVWLQHNGLLLPTSSTTLFPNFTFVTCGDADLRKLLPRQLTYMHPTNIHPDNYFHHQQYTKDLSRFATGPQYIYFKRWIDLKVAFWALTREWPVRGLTHMLSNLGLRFEGRPHSGLDDCLNMLRIMRIMAKRGYRFNKITSSM